MSALLEFLQFIEQPSGTSVHLLMERVLLKSRELTGAEAGSIFIVRRAGRQKWLEPASLQNDVVPMPVGSFRIPFDRASIAGHVAVTGETLSIPDVYTLDAGLPYHFNPEIDAASGYRTRSVLCFALRTIDQKVVGVVQLINCRSAISPIPVAFDASHADLIAPINHLISGAVERADMMEQIAAQNRRLKQRNQALVRQRERIAELQGATEEGFMLSIRLLARAAEVNDADTGNHILRVNEYSYLLALKLGLPSVFCDEIRYSAQLHDVGKMAVNKLVLKKRGPLDPEERAEMMHHPLYGYEILRQSARLRMAAEIALCHHERWDGSGYPNGLKGQAIPLSARIVAMADIYDALRAKRVYKSAIGHDEVCRIIMEGDDRIDPKGHFDPDLLAAFARHHQEMDAIWREFAD